jgi:F-type H+-transporting ATPase subunit b
MHRLLILMLGLLAGAGWSSRAAAFDEATAPAQAGEHAAAPAGAHDEAAGGAHAQPNILEFKLDLAAATAVVFVVLLLVLWRFAWGPLSKALDERERFQEEALAKTEQARADAERMLAEHHALMAQANDQVRALIEEARRDAERTSQTIVQRAQEEAEASRQRAERDIGLARDQALAEIWTRAADLSVSVAGRVLGRELGPEEHRRLIDAATQELPAAPAARNGHGAGV